MIYIDWGSTNARAWLVDNAGEILDRREAPVGIRNLRSGEFGKALEILTGAWRTLDPAATVLMSGMIGSSKGWHNTDYCIAPTGPGDLARSIVSLPGEAHLSIVPGVAVNVIEHQDVMRGEEVQVFGAIDTEQASSAVLCLPGTHSKWVRVEDARIVGFHTSMTGEIYDILIQHSLLGAEMSPIAIFDEEAFNEGVQTSQASGNLLSDLFGVRARTLLGQIKRGTSSSYLSGILVGAEIKGMLRLYDTTKPILLVASPPLSTVYQRALTQYHVEFKLKDAQHATLKGLVAVQSLR